MKTVYTIGYAAFGIKNFVRVLKKYKITCLIDVRSVPKSSYFKDFDDVALMPRLKKSDILYRNYAHEFGARQENRSFYNEKGFLDFDIFSKSAQFKSGVEKIEKALSLGYVVCLMCAEKDPINCHRAILIGRNLAENGFCVKHVLENGTTCEQKDIDNRLLDKFFPNRAQLSLFENPTDLRTLAYRLKNEEIGFRLE